MMMKQTKYMVGGLLVMLATSCGVDGERVEAGDEGLISLGQELQKGTPGAVNGTGKYCADPAQLCELGEGDCNSDAECAGDLVCGRDNGDQFGFLTGLDVCVPAHCRNRVVDGDETGLNCGGSCGSCAPINPYPNGHPSYCRYSSELPCEEGEGQCYEDSQCAGDLVCGLNNGERYGLPSGWDVCEPPLAMRCMDGVQNGDEEGVDCGGSCPDVCPTPDFVSVSAGAQHTCAALSDGSVSCWGDNFFGQLGDGTTQSSLQPVRVSGITTAIAVSLGDAHSCALLSDATVRCWGANFFGQLGDKTRIDRLTPVQAEGVTGVQTLDATGRYTCAELQDGTRHCWGHASYHNHRNPASQQLPSELAWLDVASIQSSKFHGCALMHSGAVKCWGINSFGQLGDGTTTSSLLPVDVSHVTDAVALSLGLAHSCALRSSGEVSCWGWNGSGQLGDGTGADSSIPVTTIALP